MSKKKKSEAPTHDCAHCGNLPEYLQEDKPKKMTTFLGKLTHLKGNGRYYRGESMQLTTYKLYQCEECQTYYEYGHHFWSDPESTMGLYREEDDWWVFKRLDEKQAEERLKKLK